MDSLKLYIETNIRDKSVSLSQIPELFQKAGFQVGTPVYENIQKIISDNNINVEAILDILISNLFAIFDLEQENDKKTFISMRAVLRKVVIEKMSEQLNIAQIEHFNWQQICQVFEEHVGMSDIEQSEKWYTYFEENDTNGNFLLSMKIETELEPFAKKLGLNDDQQKGLAKLLAEIQPKEENPDLNDDQEEGPAEIQTNKALLKKYIETNIKDQTIMLNTIPELFLKAGFKECTSVYKEIKIIISENEIDVGTILNTPKSELFEMFNLQEDIDKKTLLRMRTVLRKVGIGQSDKVNISQIENFNWQQICHVFEEHVGMSDIEQSEKWYTYFEENGINGNFLLNMKIKKELEPFAKKLGLNDGQQKGLAKLLAEIQPKEEVAHPRHMSLENGATGFMSMDSHVHTRDIHVGRHLPEGQ